MNRIFSHGTAWLTAMLLATPMIVVEAQQTPPQPQPQPQQPGERPGARPGERLGQQPTDRPGQQATGDPQQMLSQLDLAQADKLTNKKVHDQQGQAVGSIQEIIIDPGSGKATFAIVQIADSQQRDAQLPGQAGDADAREEQDRLADRQGRNQGQKVAVPFQALRLDSQQSDRITLRASRQQLQQRPAFEDGNYDQLKEREFVQEASRAFNVQPYFEGRGAAGGLRDAIDPFNPERDARDELQAQRLSQVKNKVVHDRQQEELGRVNDLLIDMEEGRIAYLVLQMQGNQAQRQPAQPADQQAGGNAQGQQLCLAPWAAVDYQADEERFVLDADRQTLQRHAFRDNQWPNMNDEQWARNVHQQFGEQPYWEVYGYPRYEERPDASRTQPQQRYPQQQQQQQSPQRQQPQSERERTAPDF